MTMPGRLDQTARRAWPVLCLALRKFLRIDGAQWAAAFAHYAFFSLFPLIVLLVTVASAFIDRDRAQTKIIAYVETYIPIGGETQSYIFDTIAGVVQARRQAGMVALLVLGWAAMRFFSTLISATNRACGTEVENWWRLPLKSLVFLALMVGAILLGISGPVLVKVAKDKIFPVNDFSSWVYSIGSYFIPSLVVFLGLSLFYKLAPRLPTRFAGVWPAALFATALLQATDGLFVIYLRDFATLNAVYGAFGGIMALLLWIYLVGCILIFGACLCAAQAEALTAPTPPHQDLPGILNR